MRKMVVALLFVAAASTAAVGAEQRMRFWNLTAATITKLYLAPAGTDKWGPDQCENDPDGAVDADERLNLKGIEPGRYDAKLTDKTGRRCIVRNIDVKSGRPYAFSIEEKDLTDCGH
ncbi:MAG TPA: hypothetical protein VJ747_02120 [Stellaceae bacterium]|nr:hypothetical protein [Stellaceae bacterium]